jgi:Flp pilus assembly protein TadG
VTGAHRCSERGAVAATLTPFVAAVMLFAALVLDGGRLLTARQHAADAARQAARAGADALSQTSLRTADPAHLLLNPAAAQDAARAYLNRAGVTGTISVDGATVTVTARADEHTAMLGLIGLHSLHSTVTAAARPVAG